MTEMEKLNNVIIYTFIIPVCDSESAVKAISIWCTKD